ncbi:MAG TPA: glycine zipper 2TM domain-containing protein [Steroidobacteraceae bacterium]|jgi:uncharacterized protein YcfJ|nr:glycine zipper 2TM domain-containing protein [Steroidobacteraceae bacterium]
MSSKVVTGLVSAGLLLTGQAALADSWHGKHHHHAPYAVVVYDEPQYDYARVVNVDPIVRQVRVSYPKRECWTETRYDEVQTGGPRPTAGSMILGGIIGAALGNQIGRGDGRRAATVAGAVIGSAIGHDVGEKRNANAGPVVVESRPYDVQRCEVHNVESFEDRVDGYRVTYEYYGRRQTMVLPYDPGDRVRVRVDVQPVG